MVIALFFSLACFPPGPVRAEDPDALFKRLSELYKAQAYEKALPLALELVEVRKREVGENDPDYVRALGNLAAVYGKLRRYADAVPLYKRSLTIFENALGPRHKRLTPMLDNLARAYKALGQYAEAAPLYERAVAIKEAEFGQQHKELAPVLNNLALIYEALGQYTAAAAQLNRSLAISVEAYGAKHPNVSTVLNNLADVYTSQGRYGAAAKFYARSLDISTASFGPDHPEVAVVLNNLAKNHLSQGRAAEAEVLYKRSLAIFENAYGNNHPNVATGLANLGMVYRTLGRHRDAHQLFLRALAIVEAAWGRDHPNLGTVLNNAASVYLDLGHFGQAEQLQIRSVSILEKALGADHPDTAKAVAKLADIFVAQGRWDEVELLYTRALKVLETKLGRGHPDTATVVQKLGVLYLNTHRHEEAEVQLVRAVKVHESVSSSGTLVAALDLNLLARVYMSQGRNAEAEQSLKRALAILKATVGTENPHHSSTLNNLAVLNELDGRHKEAEKLLLEALKQVEQSYGRRHPLSAMTSKNLGFNAYLRKQWAKALTYFERSNEFVATKDSTYDTVTEEKLSNEGLTAWGSKRNSFTMYVQAAERLVAEGARTRSAMWEKTFQAAQQAVDSRSAKALAQMASRFGSDKSELGTLVREHQDLLGQLLATEKMWASTLLNATGQREGEANTALQTRALTIKNHLKQITLRLRSDFPDYASLSTPQPLTIGEARGLLEEDEALLLFLSAPEIGALLGESFVWVITRTERKWVRLSIGQESLESKIQLLRNSLLGIQSFGMVGRTIQPEALDGLNVAHELYNELLAPVAEVIGGKQLLIAHSPALSSLPWQMLLTSPAPVNMAPKQVFAKAPWLIRRHAVTVLPSVSSLGALRRNAKVSSAKNPFIGIGNPLLKGPSGRDERAAQAGTCADWDGGYKLSSVRGSGKFRALFKGQLADVSKVRRLEPLPETTGELCAVGRSLGAPESAVLLGGNATEAAVKTMSRKKLLETYRVVHFATHGLVSGDLDGLAEPALVLTPPTEADREDDGLLTASEVTQLELDADWVVLSACNTAAGENGDAGALSGLARAFFYAGARALLVSHWPVSSQAAVELTTGAFSHLKANPDIGKAEALRRAMLGLIDSGIAHKTLPAFWAPFVVVGEGGLGSAK